MRKDKRKKGKIVMMQDNENKRINAGYEIIATLPVGDVEFVVGQNVHDPAMFVTWEYQPGLTKVSITTSPRPLITEMEMISSRS